MKRIWVNSMNQIRKIANAFGRGIAAGFIISFGATVYLMMENKIVASFLFCFGLFVVSEFDLNLYTGKIGYLATDRTWAYLRYVIFGLIGNFVGMLISVSILQQTRHADKLIKNAATAASSRESDHLFSLFILGIYCGILMYIAVACFRRGKARGGINIIGYLSIFFCVPLFIQSGFEHSIANLYWFMMSGKQWTLTGLWIMLVVMAGNAVGSMVTRLTDYYLLERPQRKAEASMVNVQKNLDV